MIRIALSIRIIAPEYRMIVENPIIERTWKMENRVGACMVHRADGPAIIDSFPEGRVIKRFFLNGHEKKL